jgi:hypothetical protein
MASFILNGTNSVRRNTKSNARAKAYITDIKAIFFRARPSVFQTAANAAAVRDMPYFCIAQGAFIPSPYV